MPTSVLTLGYHHTTESVPTLGNCHTRRKYHSLQVSTTAPKRTQYRDQVGTGIINVEIRRQSVLGSVWQSE
eukprot:3936575-Rhodomonas_salina.2